jgi:hypothetical protein
MITVGYVVTTDKSQINVCGFEAANKEHIFIGDIIQVSTMDAMKSTVLVHGPRPGDIVFIQLHKLSEALGLPVVIQ